RLVLALDVSGSMACRDAGPDHQTPRLTQAVLGCETFIEEAIQANYSVGLILWHHDIQGSVAPSFSAGPALNLLSTAHSSGGNDAVPFLSLAHRMLLAEPAGDMVVAIFGDGDLGPKARAQAKAAEFIADSIRILTCGLGDASAETLATISTEPTAPRSASSESIVESIVSMAAGLRKL
ncbi:MAG: hypothetical protein L0K48_06955, partial [Bifidobacterium mongoliense]|nr:hypothetical protein [Bifidobacterium mongoliense]